MSNADVRRGSEVIKLFARLSGGVDARLEPPFMVTQKKDRHYPIRGVSDYVPGIATLTSPKSWMEKRVMVQWLLEPRTIKAIPTIWLRIVFVHISSGHNPTHEMAADSEGIHRGHRSNSFSFQCHTLNAAV